MKRKSLMILMFICLTAVKMFAENVMTVKCDNYEISVPTGWMAQRTDGDTVFILYSPIEENDTIQENCVLTVEKLPGKYTVKAYLEAAREGLKTFYGDIKLIEEGKNYHIISGNVNGLVVQQIQFVEIKGTDVSVLTFTSDPANFNRYLNTFKSIYKTFKF